MTIIVNIDLINDWVGGSVMKLTLFSDLMNTSWGTKKAILI